MRTRDISGRSIQSWNGSSEGAMRPVPVDLSPWIRKGRMYSELFSKIYDVFGWNYYPEAFAQQLIEWIALQEIRDGRTIKNCLDLGCGTGILCGILQEQGIASVGVDLSPAMIGIAREHYPEVLFYTGDMTVFQPDSGPAHFDLVTCTGDAVNHLPTGEDISRMFRNVHALLRPGGSFVFDLLHPGEVSDDEPIPYEYSETVHAQFRMLRGDEGKITLQIRVYENGEFRFEEQICERIYDPALIEDLLVKAGFDEIRITHHLLEDAGNEAATWYVTCKRPIEGALE